MIQRMIPWVVTVIIVAVVSPAGAQQGRKIPRIGILLPSAPADAPGANLEAFLQGLRDLGYVEGRNIILEYRWAENREDRYHALVAELIHLKVDIIYTSSTPAVLVAKQATKTIPIVFPVSSDPVSVGIVDSLARPGGNATGLSSMASDLWPKRMELLRETFPKVSRLAMIWNSANPGMKLRARETMASAEPLGVTVQDRGVPDLEGLERVFATLSKERADAMLTMVDPFTRRHLQRILEFAAKNRLPAMYEDRSFVEAGGLMSYGPWNAELYRRSATYVDKILKGANPAELPVEQPMRFELFINLRTAKEIGVTIPPPVLYRADRIIK
jgi:putative tryptophan/tyrosine transport system substrate-binding protein